MRMKRLTAKQQAKAQQAEIELINFIEANSMRRVHGDMFEDAGGHIIQEHEVIEMMNEERKQHDN